MAGWKKIRREKLREDPVHKKMIIAGHTQEALVLQGRINSPQISSENRDRLQNRFFQLVNHPKYPAEIF